MERKTRLDSRYQKHQPMTISDLVTMKEQTGRSASLVLKKLDKRLDLDPEEPV